MTTLKDIIYYIIDNYPEPSHLSKARLTKLVYLADWKHSLDHRCQISSVKWFFDNYGPFVEDVFQTVEKNSDLFDIRYTSTIFGNKKVLLSLRNNGYQPKLPAAARQSIDHIITKTKRLKFEEFIKLVYSTYPILNSEKYTTLDLPAQASEYRKMRVSLS